MGIHFLDHKALDRSGVNLETSGLVYGWLAGILGSKSPAFMYIMSKKIGSGGKGRQIGWP